MSISLESTKEDVIRILSNKFGLSLKQKKFFADQDIDGLTLLNFPEKEMRKNQDIIPLGTQKKIKKLIVNNKEVFNSNSISITTKIDRNSTNEEINNFLKNDLKFPPIIIKHNFSNINGEKLFNSLNDLNGLDKFNLKIGEKIKLKTYLNILMKKNIENNDIVLNEEFNEKEVCEFLLNKLHFPEKIVNKFEEQKIDGDYLFSLESEDINLFKKEFYLTDDQIKSLLKEINLVKNLKKKVDNVGLINGGKDENVKNEKIYDDLKNKQISSLEKSNFNIFFVINNPEKFKECSLAVFSEENYGSSNKESKFINYNWVILSRDNNKMLIQVYSEKIVNELIINLHIEKNDNENGELQCKINITSGLNNIYNFRSLKFETISGDYEHSQKDSFDYLFEYYFEYFKQSEFKIYKKDILNNLNIEIDNSKNTIRFSTYFLLYYLKASLECEITPHLEKIELDEIKKKPFSNELYLHSKDINNLIKLFKDTEEYLIYKLINIILTIYVYSDKVVLIELIQNGNKYIYRGILNKLKKKELRFKDLYFKDEKEFILFQTNLIKVSENKDEINIIVNYSINLMSCLNLIYNNFDVICNILEKNSSVIYSHNYSLDLRLLDYQNSNNNIDSIVEVIYNIAEEKKNKNKDYYIIDLEIICEKLLSLFYDKPLNDYCKIGKLILILKKEKKYNYIVLKFYDNIHKKGCNLIKNQKMKIEEIITFLYDQDIFYFDNEYEDDENRDPNIFKYIRIVDNNKNIDTLRQYKIWELFKDNNKKITSFYQCILNQVKHVCDFKFIFQLFPENLFDRKLLRPMNEKFISVLSYLSDNNKKINEEEIFALCKKFLELNKKNNISIKDIANNIQSKIPNELTLKYYFYLLENKDISSIIDEIKEIIYKFFKEYYKRNKNPELLINLILISDETFCKYLLKQMDEMTIKEEDFYQKENNDNFILFKLFNEKCKDLIEKNTNMMKCKYSEKSILLKSKIFGDLESLKLKYDLMKVLIDENKTFLEKILVITDNDKKKAEDIFDEIKNALEICTENFDIFEKILEFYSTFKRNKNKEIIELIRERLKELKQMNINELKKKDAREYINSKIFNFESSRKESEDLKYKDSEFFMCIYREKNNEISEKSEDDLFAETIETYKNSFKRIINQKTTKESFFEIPYVDNILKEVGNKKENDLEKEIKFLLTELADFNLDENYIQNELLKDLINFSYKDKILNLLFGIKSFIEIYNKVLPFNRSEFTENITKFSNIISAKSVTGEEIEEAIDFLEKYDYNIKEEKTPLIEFYELLDGKEEAITFLKTLKDKNLDIRNLNEFIDESENSQLQTSDIECLLYISNFFNSINNDERNTNDEEFIKNFKTKFEKKNEIAIKIKDYLNSYGEIKQLYETFDENPEMCMQKIKSILKKSKIKISRDEKSSTFFFDAQYTNNQNKQTEIKMSELNELRDKIIMSSTTNTLISEQNVEFIQEHNDKTFINGKFKKIIDDLKLLCDRLSSLFKSGYPYSTEVCLKIEEFQIFDEENRGYNLDEIITNYKTKNQGFKKSIIKGYEKFPLLRLIHGNLFLKLYNKIMGNEKNIKNLLNYLTLNKLNKDVENFQFDEDIEFIENINNYLTELFEINNLKIEDIYNMNKISDGIDLAPGLYRIKKTGNYSDLLLSILNIYINLTTNCPIINTLLICNEQTTIEELKMFLYRSMLCDEPILFTIANFECLNLSIIQKISKTLKKLYEFKKKILNSYLLIIYEKVDSGLVKDIEKMIPEKNILNSNYLEPFNARIPSFNKIEVYTSSFAGYGKTTEIINKIEEKNYYYLPIGGSFEREFLVQNLENLKLNINAKNKCIHIDLSSTENYELMHEVLFKILILRYMNSSQAVFYLGYNINIKIEVPIGFIDFMEKFPILKIFENKIHIDKLTPLRLEKNVTRIGDSPISIVAEVLSLYKNGTISTTNIDLDSPITKSAKECENIINEYFIVENQNYYQKTNFIKILALQFKKFTNNLYLKYEPGTVNEALLSKTRYLLIKNFIELTTIFTKTPYDKILITQKESKKEYDEDDENKEALIALTGEKLKQEIFSFDKINPSLVFFNKDGHSLSIITNTENKQQEYQDLNAFWNSQNAPNERNELINYKSLTHEGFLEEIKKVFSLDLMDIDQLKKICHDKGNYIFVCDNFIKMIRILLNIEAKIPVILMGETGVGKTKLIEMLATLYGKGSLIIKSLNIHAGITDQDIINFIENVTEEIKNLKNEKNINDEEKIWIFLDEINTCNSLGLITEIMCNHTCLGKKINENFVFIGACNPYRLLSKQMKEIGLVYYKAKVKNIYNDLVYTVNPLPHALLNFVFDFLNLRPEDERKYINNMIISMIEKNEYNENLNQQDLNSIKEEIIDCIVICHDFIREKYDRSSVSIREINRFNIFFTFFMNYFNKYESKKTKITKMKYSLNMTLYLCYYLRLSDKVYRLELSASLKKYYRNSNFLDIPERELNNIAQQMTIEEGKGIALNRTLKENLFTCFICIINKIPLIIVGKPGTGKSLSFQIIYNSMKGKYSKKKFFKNYGQLFRYYYQGSESSTSQGIIQVFERALNAQKKNEDKNLDKKIITLVFFDEMGLAERSSNNPLKVIHYYLEKDNKKISVPFLGISNWKLDASKINRAVNLSIPDQDPDDLVETARTISAAFDENIANKYIDFFEALAKTYDEYIKYNNNNSENKDFHGNRDFYNLIKNAMRDILEKQNEILDESKILTQIGLMSLERNFGGLENSTKKIKNIFKKIYGHKYDKSFENIDNISVIDAIKENLKDPNSRYLMLISDGNDGSDIIKYILDSINKNYFELVGSKYKADLKSNRYNEGILNKIKYIMEINTVLILKDLDTIYPSLYDLFNQNFTSMGDKMFARIAFEYAKVSSEVNKNFHCVILVNKSQIKDLKLDPPFLNRFEKHIIGFDSLLDDKEKEIAQDIYEYIKTFCEFNNNKNLKINLENLLVNCKLHDIEGLIFKIINDKKDKLDKNNPDYEILIINDVIEKIVPTFCQDIIAAIKCSGTEIKYKEITEKVFNIYRKNKYNNFEQFFKNVNSRKNVIYTFSKATENIFDDEKIIENEFGIFNKKSSTIEIMDGIKSENDLIYLLKEFAVNDNKNLFILKFTENDLDKINSTNYIINNFEKENKSIKEKLIIFMVHKSRQSKDSSKEKKITYDLISFINDDYYQLFIDNLHGKENSDIFNVLDEKSEALISNEFLTNYNIIENKIYTVLNCIKFKILYETKEANSKNYTSLIARKIIGNEYIKNHLLSNLKKQASSITGVIPDIFVNEIIEINDVDFFEVINSRLIVFFCSYLLNIIYFSEQNYILDPLINNEDFQELLELEYFNNKVLETFETTKFNFNRPIKLKVYSNELTLISGFKIPESKIYLEKIIQYVNKNINDRYYKNEYSLRKNYDEKQKINEVDIQYEEELHQLTENLTVEINKYDIFKIIFTENNEKIIKYIFEDYMIYYIAKYSEKKINLNYVVNENLLKIFKLILKIELCKDEAVNNLENFNYNSNEFIKIILFSQGYNNDINNIFDVFLEINKYCDNFVEICYELSNKDIFKYETSERNETYSKIVNSTFFKITEIISRGVLLYSIELNKTNKNLFYDSFSKFAPLEANLQKINKKLYLYNKEVFNLKNIIKISEAFKSNYQQFSNLYETIVQNLLYQTENIYNNDYDNLYDLIIRLNKLIDESVTEKNTDYYNSLLYIFRQEYRSIYDEEIKINLIESFFKNNNILKNSYLFICETMKDIKPEILDKTNDYISEDYLVNNFMNLDDNKKLSKYRELYKLYNQINNQEFNEILLYFFENQCQSYFDKILKNYNNEFSEGCCESLLLDISLKYFEKANNYLCKNKENKTNNILYIYAIAFIKIYFKYFVEVNYNYFNKCNFDNINKVLNNEDGEIAFFSRMRNIYLFRVYYKKFENFDQFENYDFRKKTISVYKEINEKLLEEKSNKYIFKESFITPQNISLYGEIIKFFVDFVENEKINTLKLNFKEIDKKLNFDGFYCVIVNKLLSYLYGKNKTNIINKMKTLYELTKNSFSFNEQGQQIYSNLLNYDLLQNEIINKISETDLNQDDFEILLYSLRIVFFTQTDKSNGFYSNLLNRNIDNFINNNYIPGFLPQINLWIESYFLLREVMPNNTNVGHYICKDCGFYYYIVNCTRPSVEDTCKNGHVIGGKNHRCTKKDIRLVYNGVEKKEFEKNEYNMRPMLLDDYKREYVDNQVVKKNKGVRNDITKGEYSKNTSVRGMNIVTFRILNFVFYSHLMVAYTLNYLNKEEMKKYLIENILPMSLFGIIKETWALLEKNLNDLGIENNQVFLNMIFNKIIELINELKSANTVDKVENFERKVNEYIEQIINNKDNVEMLNKEYNELNKKLLNFNSQSLKEIIIGNFDPSTYLQELYPDIQYYTVSKLSNFELFTDKFNSNAENRKKYALINILINTGSEVNQNAKKMIHLTKINKLSNLLKQLYSYKIKRDEAKKKRLKNEIDDILEKYNQINHNNPINEEQFENEYLIPFFSSWKIIKKTSIQYKCRVLRYSEKGEKPLDLSPENKLCYFLVDEGDKEGGMFLASAYENFIAWQNNFIQDIIEKNKMCGILNGYISQISQEINIQEATNYEIINLDEEIYKKFNELICNYSMRDIFEPNNKINYKKYNDIKYNYDLIEEELGKLILPGLKKFKPDAIKFIVYLDEGFRGENSSILLDYTDKYIQRELKSEEKDALNKLLERNNNSRFYNDVLGSLQILMNEILKSNYKDNYLINNIIENLPDYVILNEKLVKFIKKPFERNTNEDSFSVNCLVSIFEYFEELCWNDIKKNILEDYKIALSDETRQFLINYFNGKDIKNKLLQKENVASSLRKLISRYIAGSRQEIDIKSDAQLKYYLDRGDLWNKNILENERFGDEIDEFCTEDILVGNIFDFYNILIGDNISFESKNENVKIKKRKESSQNADEFIINTNSNNNNDNYAEND